LIAKALSMAGLSYYGDGDKRVWNGQLKEGALIVKDIYMDGILGYVRNRTESFFHQLWHWGAPLKILLFVWLLWRGKILTWEGIQHRGLSGPGWCTLCHSEEETSSHLFFRWHFSIEIWELFSPEVRRRGWHLAGIEEAIQVWTMKEGAIKTLPLVIIWEIWGAQNHRIFEGTATSVQMIHSLII